MDNPKTYLVFLSRWGRGLTDYDATPVIQDFGPISFSKITVTGTKNGTYDGTYTLKRRVDDDVTSDVYEHDNGIYFIIKRNNGDQHGITTERREFWDNNGYLYLTNSGLVEGNNNFEGQGTESGTTAIGLFDSNQVTPPILEYTGHAGWWKFDYQTTVPTVGHINLDNNVLIPLDLYPSDSNITLIPEIISECSAIKAKAIENGTKLDTTSNKCDSIETKIDDVSSTTDEIDSKCDALGTNLATNNDILNETKTTCNSTKSVVDSIKTTANSNSDKLVSLDALCDTISSKIDNNMQELQEIKLETLSIRGVIDNNRTVLDTITLKSDSIEAGVLNIMEQQEITQEQYIKEIHAMNCNSWTRNTSNGEISIKDKTNATLFKLMPLSDASGRIRIEV